MKKIENIIEKVIILYYRLKVTIKYSLAPYPQGFKVTIKCPKCNKRLLYSECKQYETLTEHIQNPNDIPCYKPSFVCYNVKCDMNITTGIYYGMDGSRYGGPLITNGKYYYAKNSFGEWISKDY